MFGKAVSEPTHHSFLGLKSGIGIVIANMVGVGVFVSSGYMAQSLGPALILLSWVVGAMIAFAGTLAYAQVALANGRSGGEYRYLHDYMHPYMGYLAGWASLLIGFAAPIAIDAYIAGAFVGHLFEVLSPQPVGTMAILALTLGHGINLGCSQSIQNTLIGVKFLLVLLFIAMGLIMGSNGWPTWQPPHPNASFPLTAFLENQYWIAFAFSGWNAAIYAAGEYGRPKTDVSRAIVIGFLIVAVTYLLLNWVFVANLTPAQVEAVTRHEETRITLAHLLMVELIGPAGAAAISLVMVFIFLSALSAMTLIGPRVYASMADDGLLPQFFRSRQGKPPYGAVFVQGGLALFLLHTQSLLDIVKSSSAVLMLFSMLTVLSLFNLYRKVGIKPSRLSLVAAVFYAFSVGTILCFGVFSSIAICVTILTILGIGTTGYLMAQKT